MYKKINWPNSITLLRLVLIPFFCIFLINQRKIESMLLLLVIFIGDGIDGFLSRKFNQETYFGRIFDAIVDTIFLYSALITITFLGKLSLIYLVLLFIPRLLTFFIMVIKFFKTGRITYKTSRYRRMAALLLFILIFVSIFKSDVNIGALIIIIANYLGLCLELFFPKY